MLYEIVIKSLLLMQPMSNQLDFHTSNFCVLLEPIFEICGVSKVGCRTFTVELLNKSLISIQCHCFCNANTQQ